MTDSPGNAVKGPLTIEPASFTLSEGDTIRLKAKLGLTEVGASQLSWHISPTDVGRINGSGILTALKHGEATVTARYTSLEAKALATIWAIPEKIKALSSASLVGIVGRSFADSLAVTAVSSDETPVPGVDVHFEILSGSGALSHQTKKTGPDGVARVAWTLGTGAGEQEVRATATSLGEVTFSADAIPDYDSPSVESVAGDNQAGEVASQLPEGLKARVTDQYGNVLPGLGVRWSFSDGGGATGYPGAAVTATTDKEGVTEIYWRLGTVAGEQEALCEPLTGPAGVSAGQGNGPTGAPTKAKGKKFTAAANPASPDAVLVTPEQTSTLVGMSAALNAALVDPYGNVINGGDLKWQSDAPGVIKVDDKGHVTGLAEGKGEVKAVSRPHKLSGSSWVTVEARRPSHLGKDSGDGQKGFAGLSLPVQVSVIVKDQVGSPLGGVRVRWTVGAGPSGVSANASVPGRTSGEIGSGETITDENGIAGNNWTLGPQLGQQVLLASVDGLPPVEFTAEAEAGPPAVIQLSPATGETKVGQTLQFTVSARDAFGNPVTNGAYDWSSSDPEIAVGLGGGQFTGLAVGTVQVRAASGEAFGSATLEVLPSSPASTEIIGGDQQTGPAGATLPVPLTLGVFSEDGQPVQGATVRWIVAQGNGEVSPETSTTDAAGRAQTSWTLGTGLGQNRVTAFVGDLGPSSFSATAEPGPVASVIVTPATLALQEFDHGQLSASAVDQYGNFISGERVSWSSSNNRVAAVNREGVVEARSLGITTITAVIAGVEGVAEVRVSDEPVAGIEKVSGDGQSGPVGIPLSRPLRVRAVDEYGGPLGGTNIRWEIVGGGGSINPDQNTTDSGGYAEAIWTLGTEPGENRVSASLVGAGAVVFSATGTGTLALPGRVHDLSVAGVTETGVELRWTEVDDGTGRPASYAIRYGSPTMAWETAQSTEQLVSGSEIGREVTYSISGLAAGTEYQFQIASYRGALNSDAVFGALSDIVAASTGTTVVQIEISPNELSFAALGQKTQLVATARDPSGSSVPGAIIAWSSSNPSIATVDQMGMVTAKAPGLVLIVATANCCNVADTLEVEITQVPTEIVVSPAARTFLPGEVHQFSAVAQDGMGYVVPGLDIEWSSEDTFVATVSPSGLVSASSIGVTQIVAASAGISGSASVTVSGQQTPAPWFEEDFESYTSVESMLAAPHILDQTYPGGGELRLNTGLTGTPWGGTKAVESYFYGNIPEAQVGISMIPPSAPETKPREVWTEHYIKFDTNWDPGMDHKSFFYTDDTRERWHVHFGVFGTDVQALISNGNIYYDFFKPDDMRSLVWDGEWHRLRCHFRMSNHPNSDGIFRVWLDEEMIFDGTNINSQSAPERWFRGYDLGRNIGNQLGLPRASMYNAAVKIWLEDPGWGG